MSTPIDFFRLLDSFNVEWVDQGPNVARDHINVRCPFCGDDDPSYHMGIRLEDGAWACYRNPSHRGRSVSYLLQTLLGIGTRRAKELVEEGKFAEDFSIADLQGLLGGLDEEPERKGQVPICVEEFRRFGSGKQTEAPYLAYLESRGFDDPEALAHYYNLLWTPVGRFGQRIIMPVDDWDGTIVGWTSRAIAPSRARYLAHPSGEVLKDYLYNHRVAFQGGRALVLVEGPIDAWKVDWYGRPSLRAVSMMGLSLTAGRMNRLRRLVQEYDRLAILTDPGAEHIALDLEEQLSMLDPIPIWTPQGTEDPGAMNADQVHGLEEQIFGGKILY